jgi:hypothetical protein
LLSFLTHPLLALCWMWSSTQTQSSVYLLCIWQYNSQPITLNTFISSFPLSMLPLSFEPLFSPPIWSPWL